ncbi:YncE family protein [Chryseobacterium sp. JUb7]|uniref:YncE family protein n=1 Tax=Chryseobacterium sp. JUb7 TaxID=2940599 RepID=UPI00216840C4|nr:YncE family protein [Chryseobacterium sp. JUb7]MCS3529504.1 DNA-binding beta-propeller fold protein YncE [Chryseobacterium sp. JUb7]
MKILALLVSFFISNFIFGQTQYILALSKADHKMVVLDYNSLKIITRIPVGEDPHEVTTSDDGSIAYVANTAGGTAHEINVIDLRNLKPLKNIDTRPLYGSHGLAYLKDKLWFTAQGSKAVGRYDVKENQLEWSMGTGQNTTHLLYVTPDAEHFYTTNTDSGTVSIFDHVLLQPTVPPTGILPPNAKPRWDWVQTLIPVGTGAEGFDVSADGKELWTARPDGHIIVIDLEKRKIKNDIDTKVLGLHRLKFTPDGKSVCIVSVKTGELLFYDVSTEKEIKRINAGQGAAMFMDRGKNRLFMSCTPNHFVAVIDLNTMEVINKLDIGGRPDGLAMAIIK